MTDLPYTPGVRVQHRTLEDHGTLIDRPSVAHSGYVWVQWDNQPKPTHDPVSDLKLAE